MTPASVTLVNQRTDAAVARHVEVAVTRGARRRGLLGRAGLPSSSALILAPCAAIHTMFMTFAIDVVFVDGSGRALKVVEGLAPWRIAVEPSAGAVVELPAHRLRECPVSVGDCLYLRGEDGQRFLVSAADLREHLC